MKTLLKNIFIHHWPRKSLSLLLAIFIWFIISKSLSVSKNIPNVPVRIINIPRGKTVMDMEANGFLKRHVNLTLFGSKTVLDELNARNLEVVLDASSSKQDEWIATISKHNIKAKNLDTNLSQGITKITEQNIIIKMIHLATEKVPILITAPIGEAPKGYSFLDIWPYQLYITVNGPGDIIKKLKDQKLKLTFNLNDISKKDLDKLTGTPSHPNSHSDVVSFFIPNSWKKLSLPFLSSKPIEINDPQAKSLRIDFLRNEISKIGNLIPVSLFFDPTNIKELNPQKIRLATGNLIEIKNGIPFLSIPLYAKGVSSLFLELIKNRIELLILVIQKEGKKCFEWNIQFIHPQTLEDRYVHILMSDINAQKAYQTNPRIQEANLRKRFRTYLNRFELFTSQNKKLEICPYLQNEEIKIKEHKKHAS